MLTTHIPTPRVHTRFSALLRFLVVLPILGSGLVLGTVAHAADITEIRPASVKELHLIRGVEYCGTGGCDGVTHANYGLFSGVRLDHDMLVTDEQTSLAAGACTPQKCTFGPAKGNMAGPRRFTLSDPLNPLRDSLLSWDITTDEDTFGDFGPYVSTYAASYSGDGEYSVLFNSQRNLFLNRAPWNKKLILMGSGNAGLMAGIATVDGLRLLITYSGAQNLTNYTSRGIVAGRDFSAYAKLAALPASVPQMGGGPKLLLDETSVISYEPRPATVGQVVSPNGVLVLYDLRRPSAAATVAINLDDTAVHVSALNSPDGRYVFVFSARKVLVFMVEASSLTQVASVDIAGTNAAAGIVVGGEPALLSFTYEAGAIGAGGYEELNTSHPHIYLVKDMRANQLRDVYRGPATVALVSTSMDFPMRATSLVRPDASYVYLVQRAAVGTTDVVLSVWKFDASSVTANNPPAPAGGGTGGGGTGGGTAGGSAGGATGGNCGGQKCPDSLMVTAPFTGPGPDLGLRAIAGYLAGLVGSVALLFVIYGGIRYITAGGDPDRVSTARRTILYALVGLVITLLAYVIVVQVLRAGYGIG